MEGESKCDGIYTKWGGRRFLMTIFGLVICTALLFHGELESDHYKDLVIFLFGFYAAANTAQKMVETRADADVQKTQVSVRGNPSDSEP